MKQIASLKQNQSRSFDIQDGSLFGICLPAGGQTTLKLQTPRKIIIPPYPPLEKSVRLETEGGWGDLIVGISESLGFVWKFGF